MTDDWKVGGFSAFEFVLLEACGESHLRSREQHWIDTLDTTNINKGYNSHPNAESSKGFLLSDETKQKQSKAHLGHMRNKGITLTQEHKSAISRGLQGKVRISDYQKQRVSDAVSQWWEVTSPNGETTILKNLRRFCLDNNLNQSCMCGVAQGKTKQHHGWRCRKLSLTSPEETEMANYLKGVMSTKMTAPTEPVPGRKMIKNAAGGFGFDVGDWSRLHRWAILGSSQGCYYSSEKKLTLENAECVLRCIAEDGPRVVSEIIKISDEGRAPKPDPVIFILAMCAGFGSAETRNASYAALPLICRTPTHLFAFIEHVKEFRGFGSGLRKAIARWYELKEVGNLAYAMAKYQSRGGWSHRDVFRLVHPVATSSEKQALYRWAVSGSSGLGARDVLRKIAGKPDYTVSYPATVGLPRIIQAFEEAKTADEKTIVKLIREDKLPRECIPTQHLNSADVWEALLESSMPLTAMIRNLGKMSAVGLLKPLSAASKLVASKLGDQEYIRKSRVHPMSILLALKVYGQGRGEKGGLTWAPVQTVNDALDAAFYLAFGNVEPAGKRTLLAVDVSGSMSGSKIAGTSLTAREAAAAIAMVTAKTEPDYAITGFSTTFMHLDLTKYSRLDQVIKYMESLPFSGTDCALPMKYCLHEKLQVDTFITLTDSETWASADPYGLPARGYSYYRSSNPGGHVFQWLNKYRKEMDIQSRSIVAAFAATSFTIADPSDPLSLDVVGLDSATPSLISDFSAGRI